MATEGILYQLGNALLSQVQIRDASGGAPRLIPGILIHIDPLDATVDVQTDFGITRGLPRFCYDTRETPLTWQWPHSEAPEDPNDFKPTHFPKGAA